MSRPKVDVVLFAYIVVTLHVVSLVLVQVDSGIQRLEYYVSKSLHEAKVRYPPLEKAILAVVYAIRKLTHYSQAHTIVILTQLPLRALLRSVDYMGRIAKWGTILGAFDVKYMLRTSVKSQVLADLVAEFAESLLEVEAEKRSMDGKSNGTISLQHPLSWKVYVDGAANQRGSRVGASSSIPQKDYYLEIIKTGLLGHKQ